MLVSDFFLQLAVKIKIMFDFILLDSFNTQGSLIARILMLAVAIIATTYILDGVKVKGFLYSLIVAAVLILADSTLGYFLDIFTFGLFLLKLAVDAFIIQLASRFLEGFTVKNFLTAVFMAVIVSGIGTLIGWIF